MKFPKLLSKAIIKNQLLYFREADLAESDDDLVELMQWKAARKIKLVRPSTLVKLHAQGLYVREIFKIFKNSNRIHNLEKKSKSKSSVKEE